jgi:hypothetical protein
MVKNVGTGLQACPKIRAHLKVRPYSDAFLIQLVGRRQGLGFLQLHLFAAACDGAFAGLGAEHLGVAGLTLESFSKLVCHIISPSSAKRRLFLLFHRLATAGHLAGAALGNDKFRSALGADIFLANLVSHY